MFGIKLTCKLWLTESYRRPFIKQGQICFQSLTSLNEADYTVLCVSSDWWEMCVLFSDSVSCLRYLFIKWVWKDWMPNPGSFSRTIFTFDMYFHIPMSSPPLSVLCGLSELRPVCTLAVTGGREINVILKVCQQYKHGLLPAKLLKYVVCDALIDILGPNPMTLCF